MWPFVLTGAIAVVVALVIVYVFFMDHSAEETYAVGFRYTPDADPEDDV